MFNNCSPICKGNGFRHISSYEHDASFDKTCSFCIKCNTCLGKGLLKKSGEPLQQISPIQQTMDRKQNCPGQRPRMKPQIEFCLPFCCFCLPVICDRSYDDPYCQCHVIGIFLNCCIKKICEFGFSLDDENYNMCSI